MNGGVGNLQASMFTYGFYYTDITLNFRSCDALHNQVHLMGASVN